ncbi:MAG: hypothetical protein AAFT19_00465 [Pseudomonadota bacterium]
MAICSINERMTGHLSMKRRVLNKYREQSIYIISDYKAHMLQMQKILRKNGSNTMEQDAYIKIKLYLFVFSILLSFSLISLDAYSAEDKCWGRPIPAEGDHQLQKRIHEIRSAIYPPVVETPGSFSSGYFQRKIREKAEEVIQEYVVGLKNLELIMKEFEQSGGSCEINDFNTCKIQVLSEVIERCSRSAFAFGNRLKFFFEIKFTEENGIVEYELTEFYSILAE